MRLAFVFKGGLHPSGRYEVIPAWLALLERLARTHDVHAFVLQHLAEPSSYTLRGVIVHDLGRPQGGARGVVARWRQWRALRTAVAAAGPFDVCHGYWADPAGLLAALAGRRFRVPSVVTCDSGEFVAVTETGYGLQRSVGGRAVVSAACRLATRVHVATHHMERLAAARGIHTVRMAIGVDVARLSPPRGDRPEGPPWRLLQVASLNRVKDQATLLDAMAVVSRELDVHLDLVGEDTLGGAIQSHAASLGIANRVTFHGFRPFDDLPPYYQSAHLYVQSSRHEAAGVAVLEAAASGLPIVGTHVGYVADWAPDGAVAVEPGSAGALARAIVETLRDRQLRERIANNAHSFAVAHDVDWTAGKLEKLYREILNKDYADQKQARRHGDTETRS